MIKFIHTGDLHLGLQFTNVSFGKEKAMERRRELWATFQRIVQRSIDKKVDFLLIAGDLFEEAYFTLGDMRRVRDILSQAKDVNILISAGNHDFKGTKSLYNRVEWPSNVTIFNGTGIEKKEFPDLNTVVYGYSWDRVEIKENNLFNGFPQEDNSLTKILLIHGDVNSTSNYLPLNLEELKKLNMDYIALGHIHKPNLFSSKIAYCGCPEPLDFGETGVRGIIEGFVAENNTKIELLPFSRRQFLLEEVILNENMGYEDIVKEIIGLSTGRKDKDFYRITLKGYIDNVIDLSSIYKDLEDKFYHIEITNDTTPDYDLESLEETHKDNIVGQFIQAMREKGLDNEVVKDALYFGLSALLKGRVQ